MINIYLYLKFETKSHMIKPQNAGLPPQYDAALLQASRFLGVDENDIIEWHYNHNPPILKAPRLFQSWHIMNMSCSFRIQVNPRIIPGFSERDWVTDFGLATWNLQFAILINSCVFLSRKLEMRTWVSSPGRIIGKRLKST